MDSRFVPPASFTTDIFSDQQPFTASPSYTAELTRLDPPGAGRKWAGYISDARTYTPGKLITAHVPIIRPLLPDGSPNPSGFGFGWKIGSRGVLPEAPATRPVACGADLTTVNDLTICADGLGGVGGSGFNDFAFLTPAPVTVPPGQTATVPISGKLTGPAKPAINFALSASTTVPGATALTNVPTLAPPGESTTTVTVSVPVPPGTAPGTYAVTLTGTLATGETRAATGTVIVPGPGGSIADSPGLSKLTISRKSISSARGAAPAVISVTLSKAGRLRVLLERRLSGRRKNGCLRGPDPRAPTGRRASLQPLRHGVLVHPCRPRRRRCEGEHQRARRRAQAGVRHLPGHPHGRERRGRRQRPPAHHPHDHALIHPAASPSERDGDAAACMPGTARVSSGLWP